MASKKRVSDRRRAHRDAKKSKTRIKQVKRMLKKRQPLNIVLELE